MLIILAHNDSTGAKGFANYDCEARINQRVIWRGRVENHKREDGWAALLIRIAEVAQSQGEK